MDSTSDPGVPPSLRARLVRVCRLIRTIVKLPVRLTGLAVHIVTAPFRAARSVRYRQSVRKAAKQARQAEARLEAMDPWEKREVERARRLKKD